LTATSSHGPTFGSHGSRRRITWSRRHRMDFASQNDGLLHGPIRRDRGDKNGSTILTTFAHMREFHKLRTNARFICCVVHCGTHHIGLAPNRRNRSKNNRGLRNFLREVKQGHQFLWDSGTGDPTFCRRGREGSLFISLAARGTGLLIGRQVLQRKKGPIDLLFKIARG
jgi:hypothetical protein